MHSMRCRLHCCQWRVQKGGRDVCMRAALPDRGAGSAFQPRGSCSMVVRAGIGAYCFARECLLGINESAAPEHTLQYPPCCRCVLPPPSRTTARATVTAPPAPWAGPRRAVLTASADALAAPSAPMRRPSATLPPTSVKRASTLEATFRARCALQILKVSKMGRWCCFSVGDQSELLGGAGRGREEVQLPCITAALAWVSCQPLLFPVQRLQAPSSGAIIPRRIMVAAAASAWR